MEMAATQIIEELSECMGVLTEFEECRNVDRDLDAFFRGTLLPAIKSMKVEHAMHQVPMGKWVLVKPGRDEFPPPTSSDDNMDSPIVQHLLKSWSQDNDKVAYIVDWVNSLSNPLELPKDFPYGLQIVGVDSVLRDAFFSILIPVISNKIGNGYGDGPDPVLVYTRRRYKRDSDTTLPSDFIDDLRIKIPRDVDGGDMPRRSSSVGEWWESDVAPGLKNLGENIIHSPLAQNIVSILPPSFTGGLNTSMSSEPAEEEREVVGEEAAERQAEEERRREEDRRWSSEVSHPDSHHDRAKSADSGTGGIGADDQAPHRALRSSEAAMFAYDLDEALTREVRTIPSLSDTPTVTGAAEAAPSAEQKKSIIEAKLAKLREGRKGAIAPIV